MADALWISDGLPVKATVTGCNNYPTQKQVQDLGWDVLDAGGNVVFEKGTVFVCVIDFLDEFTPSRRRRFFFKRSGESSFSLLGSWSIGSESYNGKYPTVSFVIRKNNTSTYIHAVTNHVGPVTGGFGYDVYYGKYDLADFNTGTWASTKISYETATLEWTYVYPDIDANLDGSNIICVWIASSTLNGFYYHFNNFSANGNWAVPQYHVFNGAGYSIQKTSVKWGPPLQKFVYICCEDDTGARSTLYRCRFNENISGAVTLGSVAIVDAQMIFLPTGEVGILSVDTNNQQLKFYYYTPITGMSDVETIDSLVDVTFSWGLTARKADNGRWYYHAMYQNSNGNAGHYVREVGSGNQWVQVSPPPSVENQYPAFSDLIYFGCQDNFNNNPDLIGNFGLLCVDQATSQVWYRENDYTQREAGLEIVGAVGIEIDVDKLSLQRRGDYGATNALQIVDVFTMSDGTTLFADSHGFSVFDDNICTIYDNPQTLLWSGVELPPDSLWQMFAEVRCQFELNPGQKFYITVSTQDDAESKTITFEPGDSGTIKNVFLQGRAPFKWELLSDNEDGIENLNISDIWIDIRKQENI